MQRLRTVILALAMGVSLVLGTGLMVGLMPSAAIAGPSYDSVCGARC